MTDEEARKLERMAYDALGEIAHAAAQLEAPDEYVTDRYVEKWTVRLAGGRAVALVLAVLSVAAAVYSSLAMGMPAIERYTVMALGAVVTIGAGIAVASVTIRIERIRRLKQRVDLEARRSRALQSELREVQWTLENSLAALRAADASSSLSHAE